MQMDAAATPIDAAIPVPDEALLQQQVAKGHVGHEGHCAIPVQMDAVAGSAPNDEEDMPQQEEEDTVRHYMITK